MIDLTKMSLWDLLSIMEIANEDNNQILINEVAVEITMRFYYPDCGKTVKEYLADLGYKDLSEINKPKKKIKFRIL